MTLAESKKGGPYNQQQREERRSKVYELYFGKGYSAVHISKELADKPQHNKWWHQILALTDCFGWRRKRDLFTCQQADSQTGKPEKATFSRTWKNPSLKERLIIENRLFMIDNRLIQTAARLATSKTMIHSNNDFVEKEEIEILLETIQNSPNKNRRDLFTREDIIGGNQGSKMFCKPCRVCCDKIISAWIVVLWLQFFGIWFKPVWIPIQS